MFSTSSPDPFVSVTCTQVDLGHMREHHRVPVMTKASWVPQCQAVNIGPIRKC